MRFSKIRYSGEVVELEWTSKEHGGTVVAHSLESSEAPTPEFDKALQAFTPFVIELCELPFDYDKDLVVTGLSISETKDQRGLVVTATKKVARANSPFVIHTPHVRSKREEGAPDGKGLISDDMEAALAVAEKTAEAFKKGARSQQQLGLDEKPVRPTADGVEEIRSAAKRGK